MPHPSPLLTSYLRRDGLDKMMFGWVRGITRSLPGVTIERALEEFAKEFGIPKERWNISSQKRRYLAIQSEFWNDQKTPQDEQGAVEA